MFQILGTIFFSAAILAAIGVIAAMLVDNAVEIRRALGFAPVSFLPHPRARLRRSVMAGTTARARTESRLRAAA